MSLPRVGREIAPAYFDRDTNTHEMLKGRHGAMDTVILGPDGNPLFTVANPARVKDADVESRLQSVETKLDSINQRLNQTLDTQLTGSNVEHQLLDQVQISAGSTVFSQNLTHFADKYSVYVQSNPASDFSISIRPRRLDGVESGEGVDRFEESYTDRVRIVTDEFISRSPGLNIGIRNDTSEVVAYSAWVYVKGASN